VVRSTRPALTETTMERRMAALAICSIPDCGKKFHSRGYCVNHYLSFRRNGDTKRRRAEAGAPMRWVKEHIAAPPSDECVKWPFGTSNQGYGYVTHDGRHWGAHRLICLMAHGEPDDPSLVAAHSCGRGAQGCVNKAHLRWRTSAENSAEMGEHMRMGINTRHRKLSDQDVEAIRSSKNIQQKDLAVAYGVSKTMISRVVNGKHPYRR
jgi:hypothetical protein